MNKLVINKNILKEIYDDASFKEDMADLINSLIDVELEKDEPDFDLIDECADALIEIESGNCSDVIPLIAKHNFKDKDKKRKVLSIFCACAVIFSLSLGAVAVSHKLEKKKEEQTTTTTAQTTETTSVTTTVKTTEKATSTKAVAAGAVSLDLSFTDEFRSEYDSADEFSLDGIIVTVKYSDGKNREININDCKIIKSKNFGKNGGAEKVTVEYAGLTDSFYVMFSGNLAPITVERYTGFDRKTQAPKIEPSSKYIELEAGETVTLTMRKNNDGFVYISTDNDNLADASISYLGGVNGREIYLEITAGDTPGVTVISLKYNDYLSTEVMSRITVKVTESSLEPNTDIYDQ